MDPIQPLPNVGSQIERGIIAYLWEIWPVTADFPRPNFYFSNDWRVRKADRVGLIDLLAFHSVEQPQFTGNNDYTLRTIANWPGANQPGQENRDFHWGHINKLIGVPEAALKQADVNLHENYRLAAYRISAAGRRLAVFGNAECTGSATDIANNADMVDFLCDWVAFNGAERAKLDPDHGIVLVEQRNWLVRAYNGTDNSIFPALTFSAPGTLNFTFTLGGIVDAEPAKWVVQKSVDGLAWLTHEVLDAGERTSDITGLGGQYFRVFRSPDGTTLLDPESNTVEAS